jgi:hypothetical protein
VSSVSLVANGHPSRSGSESRTTVSAGGGGGKFFVAGASGQPPWSWTAYQARMMARTMSFRNSSVIAKSSLAQAQAMMSFSFVTSYLPGVVALVTMSGLLVASSPQQQPRWGLRPRRPAWCAAMHAPSSPATRAPSII